MNLIDFVVTEVLEVYDNEYGWTVRAMADSWGYVGEINIYFNEEANARAVKPGYTWLA